MYCWLRAEERWKTVSHSPNNIKQLGRCEKARSTVNDFIEQLLSLSHYIMRTKTPSILEEFECVSLFLCVFWGCWEMLKRLSAGLSVRKGQEVQWRLAEFAGNAEGPHWFGKGQVDNRWDNRWERLRIRFCNRDERSEDSEDLLLGSLGDCTKWSVWNIAL